MLMNKTSRFNTSWSILEILFQLEVYIIYLNLPTLLRHIPNYQYPYMIFPTLLSFKIVQLFVNEAHV